MLCLALWSSCHAASTRCVQQGHPGESARTAVACTTTIMAVHLPMHAHSSCAHSCARSPAISPNAATASQTLVGASTPPFPLCPCLPLAQVLVNKVVFLKDTSFYLVAVAVMYYFIWDQKVRGSC